MHQIRRVTSLSMLAVAALLALGGCGNDGPVPAAASDCTPAHKITTVKKNTLTIAAVDYYPVSVTSNGKFRGTEADLMKDFAKRNCLAVNVMPVSFAGAIPAVQSHRADVAIGGFYRTAERSKVVGLSDPVYVDRLGAVSKEGLSSVSGLVGKKVGTVDGYLWVSDAKKLLGSNLTVYPSNVEMKADLKAGRIAVALDSFGGAKYTYKDLTDFTIAALEPDSRIAATKEPAQIGFPFTRGDQSLETGLNDAIKAWRADGTLVGTLKRYGASVDILDVGTPRLVQ